MEQSRIAAVASETHRLHEQVAELRAECSALRTEVSRIHARLRSIERRLEQGSVVLDKHASLYGRLSARVNLLATNLTDMFTTAGINFRVLW